MFILGLAERDKIPCHARRNPYDPKRNTISLIAADTTRKREALSVTGLFPLHLPGSGLWFCSCAKQETAVMNPRKQSVSVRVILPNTDRGHIIGVLSGDSVLLQNAIYISRFCGYSFCLKPAFIFRFQTVRFLSAACLFAEIQVR